MSFLTRNEPPAPVEEPAEVSSGDSRSQGLKAQPQELRTRSEAACSCEVIHSP